MFPNFTALSSQKCHNSDQGWLWSGFELSRDFLLKLALKLLETHVFGIFFRVKFTKNVLKCMWKLPRYTNMLKY